MNAFKTFPITQTLLLALISIEIVQYLYQDLVITQLEFGGEIKIKRNINWNFFTDKWNQQGSNQ